MGTGLYCPVCKKEVEPEHFSCVSGAKGGAAGTGKAKARSSDQARAAVCIRWAKKYIQDRAKRQSHDE